MILYNQISKNKYDYITWQTLQKILSDAAFKTKFIGILR